VVISLKHHTRHLVKAAMGLHLVRDPKIFMTKKNLKILITKARSGFTYQLQTGV
jgi:hypothetical protein